MWPRATAALLCIVASQFDLHAQTYADNLPLSHPAIQYFDGLREDAVLLDAVLLKDLPHETRLPALLEHFGINADSQTLVFSKTSFQAAKVSPSNPRAIYFNDEVAVAYVPGGATIEIAAADPRQGVIFYSLNQSGPALLERREVCLKCHQGPATLGVPGIFVGSVYPGATGMPARSGAIITDHRTPFVDRWGGWYVNAKAGEQPDRANAVSSNPAAPETLDTRLSAISFKSANYLTPVSDIVALMTFEHQTHATNLITRLNWELRMEQPAERTGARLEELVRYMMFLDEPALHEPIKGVSSFTSTFPKRGPRDRQGRSLRDFNLETRLFRYPLSYMIYSRAFDALPAPVKARFFQRVLELLSADDRKIVRAILDDTKLQTH